MKFAKSNKSDSLQNVWNDGIKFQKALMTQDLPEGVSLNSLGLRYFTPREVSYVSVVPVNAFYSVRASFRQCRLSSSPSSF